MDVKNLRQILKALGDDTRLRIINLLSKKELTVKEICRILKKSQPTISKHLIRLRLLKIVIDRREGNFIYYRLNLSSFQGDILEFLIFKFSHLDIFINDKKAL
ncbi:MAG: metalloregulator ArsR/SmtB family transcription factor [Candidatus Omnitrophica bacterium]|nr:metalloregulator ArsR/SmtB family transcription factor [Candidatus Omnitrophota bacterium]